MRTIELLVSTVILRPYVFIFFACYLFLAITRLGLRRAVLFTVIAYLIAFASEWSSAVAGTGFPFGLYRYIEETRDRELWIAGVPFMDSLSFAFLSFISWEMGALCMGLTRFVRREARVVEDESARKSLAATLLASLFMTCLDIVIDPVALRGDRWFLGKLYFYPEGGSYFGVTIANFLGWFLVCFVILRVFIFVDRRVTRTSFAERKKTDRVATYGAVALYFGVLGFNLTMTFWIGETSLGLIGLFLTTLLAVIVGTAVYSRSRGAVDRVATGR